MNTQTSTKLIKNKLGLLKLAENLGNVSEACRVLGSSRDSFYRYKEQYEKYGEQGLQEISRKKPIIKNRVDEHVENAVVGIATEFPAFGQLRASNELKKKGIFVSPGGVRNIWKRHNLHQFNLRLKALEAKSAKEGLVYTEEQIRALEKAKEEKIAYGEIDTLFPGYLGAQDTFYVGTIKGVGRIYQQTFIDTYSKVAFAKLYDRKNALVAADTLNDKVIPFYEEQEVKLLRILTDRGTEYKGVREHHEYELYLAVEDIEHTYTKSHHPQTNGICERFHKTVLNEFYSVVFRKKYYNSKEELQIDLDNWMNYYNHERTHQGAYCFGDTPMNCFHKNKHLAKVKMIGYDNISEINKEVLN